MKTAELTGAALDWAVAKCEGIYFENLEDFEHSAPDYVTNWAQGGPIIERERLSLFDNIDYYEARTNIDHKLWQVRFKGPTHLIAAMRCYVASKLGDEIDLPKELTK